MPFCPMLYQELDRVSKPKKGKQQQVKDPFVQVDKFFPTMDPVESTLLQPRSIPNILMDEMPSVKLQNAGATGETARLSKNSAEGQKEEAALKDLKHSSSYLRLVNSQELSIEAMKSLNQAMTANLDALSLLRGLPPQAASIIEDLQSQATSLALGANDLGVANNNMAKCVVSQYTEALKNRQAAWVNSSNLQKTTQAEICKSGLDMPKGDSTEPLSVLNSKGVSIVQAVVDKRHGDVYRDWYKKQNQVQSRGRQPKRGGRRPQNQSAPFSSFVPSGPAQAAGWSTQPVNTQRGRGGQGRGRGSRGRGRGSAPFTQARSTQENQ